MLRVTGYSYSGEEPFFSLMPSYSFLTVQIIIQLLFVKKRIIYDRNNLVSFIIKRMKNESNETFKKT